MMKWKHTSFDGEEIKFETLKKACLYLGLRSDSLRVKFHRRRKAGKSEVHTWEGGKLERI